MRIQSLEISNFRAIHQFKVSDLTDSIILAGPNGCGKSTVMDAIRLLKSAYGQHQANEYQKWFQEFQIGFKQKTEEPHRVLRDPTEPLIINATINLAETEVAFLREQGQDLSKQVEWSNFTSQVGPMPRVMTSPRQRIALSDRIRQLSWERMEALKRELDSSVLRASFALDPSGEPTILSSPTLELIFSTYAPLKLGMIDFHSATRSYSRERINNVKLDISEDGSQIHGSALYDTHNKYSHIKSEMASAYVRELLAKAADTGIQDHDNIITTLQELFTTFFPEKRFLGPQPTADGKLLFPIEIPGGKQHDLDDLSSGEKEVLLGYLRLRNSAPRNSVILLDEPELHLNPRIIRRLPWFYQKHLGQALNNQIWMSTHSDALLRGAVEEPTYVVFHMKPASATPVVENQAIRVSADKEVERAVIDLIGDLATYTPHARIVILEGGGESEFDINLMRELFPDFSESVNLLSGGSKGRTRELHELLDKAATAGTLRAKFFSIVDKDFEGPAETLHETRFTWDVYHIENYLLHPESIQSAIKELSLGTPPPPIEDILGKLIDSARDTIGDLVRIRMQTLVNSAFLSCLDWNTNARAREHAPEFRRVAEKSAMQIQEILNTQLSVSHLQAEECSIKSELENSLVDGTWLKTFRGREVLSRFLHRMRLTSVKYEHFRNSIIHCMRRQGYQPRGIKQIVDDILRL